MRGSPVNRLERHWPQPTVPEIAEEGETESAGRLTKPSWEEGLENFMGEHPKLTLAAAAAVGLVLGWMVKRK